MLVLRDVRGTGVPVQHRLAPSYLLAADHPVDAVDGHAILLAAAAVDGLAAIVAGSLPAGKGLSLKARARIPVALATMHMCWGFGFLTSPRALANKVIASRRPSVRRDTADV